MGDWFEDAKDWTMEMWEKYWVWILLVGGFLAWRIYAAYAPAQTAPVVVGISGLDPHDLTAAYNRIQATILASGVSDTFTYSGQDPDTWGDYALRAGYTVPSADQMEPGNPRAHSPVTFQQWWTKFSPYLQGQPMSSANQSLVSAAFSSRTLAGMGRT
jgi:hypothetical protein